MEIPTLEDYVKNASHSYKTAKSLNRSLLSTPPLPSKKINTSSFPDTNSFPGSPDQSLYVTADLGSITSTPSLEETLHNVSELTVENDTLRTQLEFYKQNNDRLTEEKMRLSQQLGVQTQVKFSSMKFHTPFLSPVPSHYFKCSF